MCTVSKLEWNHGTYTVAAVLVTCNIWKIWQPSQSAQVALMVRVKFYQHWLTYGVLEN